jgi:hypothetical protein
MFHRNKVTYPFTVTSSFCRFAGNRSSFAPCELRAHPEYLARPPIHPEISSLHRNLREIQLEFLRARLKPV